MTMISRYTGDIELYAETAYIYLEYVQRRKGKLRKSALQIKICCWYISFVYDVNGSSFSSLLRCCTPPENAGRDEETF
jgi:hypothetical protein